ncbi:hypothetical protein BpHYR1_027130, partial [Brachionus plicatilis]
IIIRAFAKEEKSGNELKYLYTSGEELYSFFVVTILHKKRYRSLISNVYLLTNWSIEPHSIHQHLKYKVLNVALKVAMANQLENLINLMLLCSHILQLKVEIIKRHGKELHGLRFNLFFRKDRYYGLSMDKLKYVFCIHRND